ncbi:MAG: hypothetical protein NTZ78_12675 [Candidatus Aureabacteria bacterium]|nr:hypothetical protein [Candidatus Auribacterota bacterium]
MVRILLPRGGDYGTTMAIVDGTGVKKDFKIAVDRDAVLRRLQMNPSGYGSSGKVQELVEKTMELGYRIIEPAAACKTLGIARCGDSGVSFRDTAFTVASSDIADLLRSCRKTTVMAATIGKGLTLETGNLMTQKRMTEAIILDAFGSEAVEAVVNLMCGTLREAAVHEKMTLTRRFSPGYGDWKLPAQRGIIRELGAHRIGIRVNENFILIPEKSITAIMGWK